MKKLLITRLNSVSSPVRRVLCGLCSALLALALAPAAFGATVTNVFTSSGTFNCPAGVTSIKVECWGGGGAGGSAVRGSVAGKAVGGGGGGGGYIRANAMAVAGGNSYTITIPAVATAPAVGTGFTDGDISPSGGDVSFTDDNSITITAKGGSGGQCRNNNTNTATGGAGGSPTGGDQVYAGGKGADASGGSNANLTGGGGGSSPSDIAPGTNGLVAATSTGGSATIGSDAAHSGGSGANGASNNPGVAGSPPGGGGGGASTGTGSTTFRQGGQGAKGQIIITYTTTAATATKMLTVLPGQTFTSGSAPTGTPTAQTAGTAFTVTNYAVLTDGVTVDTTYNGNRTITLTGPTAGTFTPTSRTILFTSGVATYSVTLKQAVGSVQLTATDGTLTGLASSAVQVNVGSLLQLQVLLPGETAAAGTATGKTGTPSAQTVGTPFNATINAVDTNYNVVISYTGSQTITLTGPDTGTFSPSAGTATTFSSGSASFSVTLNKAAATTLTLSDGTYSGTSASIAPAAGSVTKLQILMPGETAAAGTTTSGTPGKTGTPSGQRVGLPFNVTVNAVDAYWNVVSNATPHVNFTSSNSGTTSGSGLPANGASVLAAGTGSFPVTFATGNVSSTVTANDAASVLTLSQSASTAVSFANLFRSANASGGNWGDNSTWQESTDGGATWSAAGAAPTSDDSDFVTIRSGFPVTVDVASSAAGVTVNNGAILNVSGNVLTVTPNSAADVDVHGTLNLSYASGNALTITGGTMTLESDGTLNHSGAVTQISGGTLTFNGLYKQNIDGGTIPTATWAATSTCEIDGMTATIPTGLAQAFGNMTWNCSSQTVGATNNPTSIAGNMRIQNTGLSFLSMAKSIGGNLQVDAGATNNLTVGTYTVSGSTTVSGTVNLSGASGTKTFTGGITVNSGGAVTQQNNSATYNFGDLTVNSGGSYVISGTPAVMNFTGNMVNNGTYTAGGGSYTNSLSGASKTISGTWSFNTGGSTFSVNGTYQNNGTLSVNSGTFNGTGTLTQGANATLNLDGNNAIAAGTVTLVATASGNTVNYDGAAQPVYGTTYYNLTLSASGAKTLGATTTVIGTLTRGGAASLNLGGGAPNTNLIYGTSATLKYAGTNAQTAASTEFPGTVGACPPNVEIANTNGVKLNTAKNMAGTLTLDANTTLDFNLQTMIVSNTSLSSSSALIMEVTNAAGTITGSKLTQTAGTLTYAGTLTVTATGDALANGNIIPLFSATSGNYGGGFTSVTPPSQSGLTANTSQLTGGTGGNISYSSGVTSQPAISSVHTDGSGNLIISGTNGTASGTYSVLTSTNVAAPLSTWVTNMTGTFSGNNGFTNTIPINSNTRQSFFIIKQP